MGFVDGPFDLSTAIAEAVSKIEVPQRTTSTGESGTPVAPTASVDAATVRANATTGEVTASLAPPPRTERYPFLGTTPAVPALYTNPLTDPVGPTPEADPPFRSPALPSTTPTYLQLESLAADLEANQEAEPSEPADAWGIPASQLGNDPEGLVPIRVVRPPELTFQDVEGLVPVPVNRTPHIAAEAYEALNTSDGLEAALDDQPITEWNDIELHALTAVAIDNPDQEPAIQAAVAEAIANADSLEDLPAHGGFQYLLERYAVEGNDYGTRAELKRLVSEDLNARLDSALGTASGDNELDAALTTFGDSTQELIDNNPALFPIVQSQFESVIEENHERIVGVAQADDPWYSQINHSATGWARRGADEIAHAVFPDYGPVQGGGFGGGEVGQFLRSDWGVAIRGVSDGFSVAGRDAITGPVELVTDPVGAAQGVYAVIKDPSLLLEGYRQIGEERGPYAVVGAFGFDYLTAVASLGTGGATAGVSRAGLLRRLIGATRAPDAPDLAPDLHQAPRFGRLDGDVQQLAIERAQRLAPEDAHVIDSLVRSDGFYELDATTQRELLRWAGSNESTIGGPGRQSLRGLINSPVFEALSPEAQASYLDDVLRLQSGTGHLDLDGAGPYTPAPWTAEPLEWATHTFHNESVGGVRSIVEIDGHRIEVIGPGGNNGAFSELGFVSNALASLPPDEVARIQRVVVEPEASAGPAWMTADLDGTIRVYPSSLDLPSDAFTDVAAHELGHLISYDELGPFQYDPVLKQSGATGFVYDSPLWERWAEATEADGLRPSQYATADLGEDFAETYRIYTSRSGRPEFDELRQLMPERFAILDELTGAS